MIVLPVCYKEDPKHCPSCKKPEDIVESCNHCGHKYENKLGCLSLLFIGLFIIFGVIALISLVVIVLNWIMEGNTLWFHMTEMGSSYWKS